MKQLELKFVGSPLSEEAQTDYTGNRKEYRKRWRHVSDFTIGRKEPEKGSWKPS